MSSPPPYDVTYALDQVRRRGNIAPAELRVLTYLVEQTLAGNAGQISQKTIAADVFGKDLTAFDPKANSTIRTTASNLRGTLQAYYAGPGRSDSVMIELPAGTYIPKFSAREPVSAAATSRLWSARGAMEARTTSGYEIAIKHLDAVLAEAPRLSLALALKSEAVASWACNGLRPMPALQEAKVLAERAVEQPSPSWQAWTALGGVQMLLDWNWTAAEESFGRAIAGSGGEAVIHIWHTSFLASRGRAREAAAHMQRTVGHFGYSNPTYAGDLTMLLMIARDFTAAAATIEAGIEATPAYYQHYMNRAILYEAQDDPAAAVRALDQTPLRLHERPMTWGLRGLFAGRSGAPSVARRRISWMRTVQKTGRYIPPNQFALCQVGLGDLDEAVRCLEMGTEHHDPLVIWYRTYPFFRHLYKHTRFRELAKRAGLVEHEVK